MDIPGITIDALTVKALTDDQIAELHRLACLQAAESHPEDPLPPLELYSAGMRNIPDFVDTWAWVARRDGEPVGSAQAAVSRTGDNEHLVEAGVSVVPEYRRQGIGSRLLAEIVAVCESEGRTSIVSGSSERVAAGGEFAARIGARAAMQETVNRLDLATVDRALVDRWVTEGPARAPGYSLVAIDGDVPDEQLPAVLAAVEMMNTAPREDLDIEDFRLTPEMWRAQEQSRRARGGQHWMLLALQSESGAVAGYTAVSWNPALPDTIHQQGTAVHPDHRSHALGKWLKAAMLQRLLAERPEAKDIRTGNANSNDAMLAINRQLGFESYISETIWQIEVDQARAYLAGAAATATS